jgi:alkylation response protein AidB-like acyl-CoA dehydrogenase
MDFSFTEEQSMLRDTLASYLRDRYDPDTRRAVAASEAGWRPEVWKAFAEELGILGLPFPEEMGGLGGGAVETVIVMEALGSALVVEPFLETVVLLGGLLARSGWAGAPAMSEAITTGEAIVAFAGLEPGSRYDYGKVSTTAANTGAGYRLDGHKAVVMGAPWATHLLVTACTSDHRREGSGVSLFLVEKSAPGVSTQDYPTVDGRRASEVRFDGVQLGPDALVGADGAAMPLVRRAVDEATVGVCAEAVGVLRRLHESTLEYARQRRQFGRPIGDFQVLQHRMVDMFMALEQAVSATYMAALKLDEPDGERAKAVSAAKVTVGKACRFVGQNAVQVHGGIGMTDELPLSWWFKRATMIESEFGSVDHHLARYQALSLHP